MPVLKLTDGDEEQAPPACMHCGGYHVRQCPRVSEMEFAADGRITRVRFQAPGWEKLAEGYVVWPEDLQEEQRVTMRDMLDDMLGRRGVRVTLFALGIAFVMLLVFVVVLVAVLGLLKVVP